MFSRKHSKTIVGAWFMSPDSNHYRLVENNSAPSTSSLIKSILFALRMNGADCWLIVNVKFYFTVAFIGIGPVQHAISESIDSDILSK
jgi:hypothetical protein